jgi:hypothetical protein
MPKHLSERLAWHMDGWNGRICPKPGSNSYCVGPHSYPGDRSKAGATWLGKNRKASRASAAPSSISLPEAIAALGMRMVERFSRNLIFLRNQTAEYFIWNGREIIRWFSKVMVCSAMTS